MTVRLFTGIEVPTGIAAQLDLMRGGVPGARWIEPSDMHVTLRFVGDVDEDVARDIDRALADMASPGPLDVVLDGLDQFGGDKPRALFARAVPSGQLLALQRGHEAAVRAAGAPPDSRRFMPHVTLARLGGRVAAPDVASYLARQAPMHLSFTTSRAALYSARASTGGGPYRVESVYPLG